MGYEIIRVSPDEDLYLEWSSIVEAPTFVGTRTQLLVHLHRNYQPVETPEQRVDRTDETGSSGRDGWGCKWDATGEIYMQRGFLPRARMAEFARRLLADQNAEPTDLLEPFDDEPAETGR